MSNNNYLVFLILYLIQSEWGGTRIEPWSKPLGLEVCNIDPFVNDEKPTQSNSYLYNSMIHPLTRLSIKGVLWYQGIIRNN